jgi:CBS domain containing-hemolysin-like protein
VAASAARVLNAARFDTLRVEDVMVPRADIIAVEVDTPLGELATMLAEAAHSRLPVYRETLDEPVGVVHIKDVLRYLADAMAKPADSAAAEQRVLPTIVRPVIYVPPSMPAADLLLRMQTKRMHMAIVVDEFGGTDGLVTLEDLVEQIVGDIADEHDDADEPAIRARGPEVWEAEARAEIDELEALTQRTLVLPEAPEEVDTLGGLVFTLAGRVPERGEVIEHPAGVEFEVIDADPRRVKRMIVRLKAPASPAPAAGGGK